MRLIFLYSFLFYPFFTSYTMKQTIQFGKKISQKGKKTLLNSKDWRVYVFGGLVNQTVARNKRKIMNKLHEFLLKDTFNKIMKNQMNEKENKEMGFSYSKSFEDKNYPISDEQINTIYEYYSNIFSETSMDTSGNVRFRIKNLFQEDNYKSPVYIIESINYFSQICTLMNSVNWGSGQQDKKSKTVFAINNLRHNIWVRGMSQYKHQAPKNINFKETEFQMINNNKIDEKKYDKLGNSYEELLQTDNKLDKIFLLSLIPSYDQSKFLWLDTNDFYYYIINNNLEFFKIAYDDLNLNEKTKNLESDKIYPIGSLKNLIIQSKEINQVKNNPQDNKDSETKKQSKKEDVKYIEYKNFIPQINKNLFQGNNPGTNYLTFLALNLRENNNLSIEELSELITKIADNDKDSTVYDFNLDNIDGALFFLFGYQGQLYSKSLPYSFYIQNVKNFEESEKNKKTIVEIYDIPIYSTRGENISLLSKALTALPQYGDLFLRQTGFGTSVLFLKDSFAILLDGEYFFIDQYTDNISLQNPSSNGVVYLSYIYSIYDNVYLGPSLGAMPTNYIGHQYFDLIYSLCFLLHQHPVLISIKYGYNVTKNTCVFNIGCKIGFLAYGEEIYNEEDKNDFCFVELL